MVNRTPELSRTYRTRSGIEFPITFVFKHTKPQVEFILREKKEDRKKDENNYLKLRKRIRVFGEREVLHLYCACQPDVEYAFKCMPVFPLAVASNSTSWQMIFEYDTTYYGMVEYVAFQTELDAEAGHVEHYLLLKAWTDNRFEFRKEFEELKKEDEPKSKPTALSSIQVSTSTSEPEQTEGMTPEEEAELDRMLGRGE